MVSTTPDDTEILWIVSKALHRAYDGINLTETGTSKKDRLAAVSPKSDPVF
jgi:hypothetical protein